VIAIKSQGAESMSSSSSSDTLLQQFQLLFTSGAAAGVSDGELLDRFRQDQRDTGEAAFAALVERHGPMVLRVCRQALRDGHDAEDAFQATFLVLSRQAHSIRNQNSLASWLFGVARRAAASIRMEEARRRRHELERKRSEAHLVVGPGLPPDSCHELHAEIERLPERYRVPILLCYFEGLTHEQAASRLSWPIGTVKTRLSRALAQLRSRLKRGGWTALPMMLSRILQPVNVKEIPPFLLRTTTSAAARFTTGVGAGEFVSPGVLTTANGVLRAMWINKLRLAALVVFGVLGVGLATAVVAQQATGNAQLGDAQPTATAKAGPPVDTGLQLTGSTALDPEKVARIHPRFDCRVDKVLVRLGDRVKKGDPLLELFSMTLAEARNSYEAAKSEWAGHKRLLDIEAAQEKGGSLPHRELIETENKEAKSRLQLKLAKEKLLLLGLTEKAIEDSQNEDGDQKARMILRSPRAGVVVELSTSPGEICNEKSSLLIIAQDDRLWVTAAVSQLDINKVQVGQHAVVSFPGGDHTAKAKVEAKDIAVDPQTGCFNIRMSISNPNHWFKPGMFVIVQLGAQRNPEVTENLPRSGEPRSELSLEERLSELERKVDRLVAGRDGRPASARIHERLSELERKVDRLLDVRKGR
jgi:RNA polymerase sigma factor (sigma-70 family)